MAKKYGRFIFHVDLYAAKYRYVNRINRWYTHRNGTAKTDLRGKRDNIFTAEKTNINSPCRTASAHVSLSPCCQFPSLSALSGNARTDPALPVYIATLSLRI